MKLLASTEKKINENKNGENLPRLEITEVVLLRCNVVNNDYQHVFKSLVYIFFKHIIWTIIRYFT